MFLAQCKTATRLRLVAGLSAAAMSFLSAVATPAAEPASKSTDLSWIDQRVADWDLSEEERRFDEIGWAAGLTEAEHLTRQAQRPLFVFTYSGSATEANAIALRRC